MCGQRCTELVHRQLLWLETAARLKQTNLQHRPDALWSIRKHTSSNSKEEKSENNTIGAKRKLTKHYSLEN